MAPGTGKGLETVGEAVSTIAEEGMDKAELVTGNRSLRRPGVLFPRGRAVRIRWPEAGRRPGRCSGAGLGRDGFRVRVARCLAFSPPPDAANRCRTRRSRRAARSIFRLGAVPRRLSRSRRTIVVDGICMTGAMLLGRAHLLSATGSGVSRHSRSRRGWSRRPRPDDGAAA